MRIKTFCIFLLSTLYEHPGRADFELFIGLLFYFGSWNYSLEASLSLGRCKTETGEGNPLH